MIHALREWADRFRSRGKYTPIGVIFHWTMAGLVIFQLVFGWMMYRYPVGGEKIRAYELHSEVGLLLLLGGLRLLWRLMVPGPINDADAPGWRSTVAHAIHVAFYALFVVLPVSGWMMWSSIYPARPLYLAGLVPLPAMPFQDFSPEWQFWVLEYTGKIHAAAVIVLSLLVPLHAAAAIKHHFWNQDDVFEGILPEVPDAPGGSRYIPPEEQSPPRPEPG